MPLAGLAAIRKEKRSPKRIFTIVTALTIGGKVILRAQRAMREYQVALALITTGTAIIGHPLAQTSMEQAWEYRNTLQKIWPLLSSLPSAVSTGNKVWSRRSPNSPL